MHESVPSMKKRRAIVVLVCALSLPLPSSVAAMEDIFGAMFRMMLVMMNVMSDAMLDNNNTLDFGAGSSLGLGMGSWPAMGSLNGMNPYSGVGGYPGMSPWSGLGGFPGSGTGMSPWSTRMMPNSWGSPFAGGYPPYASSPYSSSAYGGWPGPGAARSGAVSLLDGRWFGQSGEVLEIRGDRFRLVYGKYGISGVIKIKNNIVNLYSQQTGTVTQYTFIRNQTDLVLQDSTGHVLSFSKRPINRFGRIF